MGPKEKRIFEIMDEYECNYDIAEWMFEDEICEKYNLSNDDLAIAEAVFLADYEDKKI